MDCQIKTLLRAIKDSLPAADSHNKEQENWQEPAPLNYTDWWSPILFCYFSNKWMRNRTKWVLRAPLFLPWEMFTEIFKHLNFIAHLWLQIYSMQLHNFCIPQSSSSAAGCFGYECPIFWQSNGELQSTQLPTIIAETKQKLEFSVESYEAPYWKIGVITVKLITERWITQNMMKELGQYIQMFQPNSLRDAIKTTEIGPAHYPLLSSMFILSTIFPLTSWANFCVL